jgi:hypothetical protein
LSGRDNADGAAARRHAIGSPAADDAAETSKTVLQRIGAPVVALNEDTCVLEDRCSRRTTRAAGRAFDHQIMHYDLQNTH